MLASMKTGTKILLGFAFAVVVAVAVGLVGISGLSSSDASIKHLGGTILPSTRGLGAMREGQFKAAYAMRGLSNARLREPRARAQEYAALEEGLRTFDEGRARYEPLPQGPEEARHWRELVPHIATWKGAVQLVVERAKEFDQLLASNAPTERVTEADNRLWEATAEARTARVATETRLAQISETNSRDGDEAATQAEVQSARDNSIVLWLLAAGALLLALLGFYLVTSVSKSIQALIAEATRLEKAAVAGQLATRGDATLVAPEFRPIVTGVNETLDAVVGPLNVAATYIARISKGDVPQKITDSYNGDFNEIKNNLNQCVEAVGRLVQDTHNLSTAAVEGRLATRADVSRHNGDFAKVVQGVNETLDAVITPVMEATRVLETLANCDLRARVDSNYQGDHARLKDALNSTATALHDALLGVANAVEQVGGATRQIAESSQSVAQGSSEQASALEETSSSLEEMSGMTKQNADNTIQAKSLAQTTKEAAEKGGLAMHRMTDAMEKIRAASEGTAQIIKDINEIAFQTNLLALNAAVEAARAGEAGRGFAVVAEEVRNLALRSKEAAKKTEDLIRMSVSHAENGRVISGEVAGNLTEIVTAAAKVNEIVSEIAVASQEQSRGIDQVNKAVAEMDKVVQTAAANAEESSSAAEELSSQAEELGSLVGRFTLSRAAAAATRGEPVRTRRVPLPSMAPRRGAPAQARTKAGSGQTASTIRLSPEELIPLKDDPDFKEF